jgi:predicted DNA-binding helix-hairpin-helix protein
MVDAIHRAVMPNGKRIKLLKTLLTSACERDCAYCAFRAGRDFRRATFGPDELAALFFRLYQAGVAEGIFLSSGVAGSGPRTQDRLIATAEILRHRFRFRDYIHLKIMPGAERDQVAAAMRLADRVSVNLEAPNQRRLTRLAPHKTFNEELLRRLRWIEEIRRDSPGRWPSSTTQFVVGAADESDLELLTTTDYLHRRVGLARAYFSGFSPVPDTPLESHAPTQPQREHRLYQSSYLLRDYGFEVEELAFDGGGNLPLDVDPKLAWARAHLADAPVEVNTADRHDLLRVPGIGPKGVERVLAARRDRRLYDLGQLRKLGIVSERAAPFVLLDGRAPARQLSFWPT